MTSSRIEFRERNHEQTRTTRRRGPHGVGANCSNAAGVAARRFGLRSGCRLWRKATSMLDEAGRLTPGPFGRPVTSYGPSMCVADLLCWRSRDLPGLLADEALGARHL